MESKVIEQTKSKDEIIKILNANNISYKITECEGYERICVLIGDIQKVAYKTPITLQTCNKDICKVYQKDILYIAIENRKSVLYLIDGKLETNYNLNYWKNVLSERTFAQPHYSYIVNLNYVDKIAKDFVKLKYGDEEYKVYTSLRKIGEFKKAFLEFSR